MAYAYSPSMVSQETTSRLALLTWYVVYEGPQSGGQLRGLTGSEEDLSKSQSVMQMWGFGQIRLS